MASWSESGIGLSHAKAYPPSPLKKITFLTEVNFVIYTVKAIKKYY